jgi:tetrahydromethanopterin S-methyltransferase subunit B
MAKVEERVAHLEGHMNELSQRLSGVEAAIRHLEQRTDTRFDSVDRRFDALDAKMSRQFMWLVGIQITTLVAIVVALISRG